MMRKLLMIVWLVGFSILLASCEVPAPGTPLPTVTPLPNWMIEPSGRKWRLASL